MGLGVEWQGGKSELVLLCSNQPWALTQMLSVDTRLKHRELFTHMKTCGTLLGLRKALLTLAWVHRSMALKKLSLPVASG